MTSGNRCAANRKLRPKLFAELDKIKETQDHFYPNKLATKFNIPTRRIVAVIRERDDIYLWKKNQEIGVGSIWRFREVDEA